MTRTCWTIALVSTVLVTGIARAQEGIEKVPDDAIRQVAPHILASITQNLPGAGIKIDGVPDNALGFRRESAALLLMPDRGFTAKTIEGVGEKVVPVGLLLLKNLSPLVKGQVPAPDQLALLGPDGDLKAVTVLFLGVHKLESGLVLEVYSKDSKPLYQVPLKSKAEARGAALLEGKFANVDQTARQADFVATFGGAYEATIRIAGKE